MLRGFEMVYEKEEGKATVEEFKQTTGFDDDFWKYVCEQYSENLSQYYYVQNVFMFGMVNTFNEIEDEYKE